MSSTRPSLPDPDAIRALPADGGPEFNRLIHETSPYLLQHARNPVDWHPWGRDAFEQAKREDKPVFLSVGYSSCHWCHVMERESFERDDVASILNAHFVCIKVDREERPDVDDLYMVATQIMTGRGGWPNSVWLLPDGRPWYAGTYFPREDRGGRPGFKSLLRQLADVWSTRRAAVEEQAGRLADAVRQHADMVEIGPCAAAADLAEHALARLEETYDPRHGGFGGAPKFPPHTALGLLLGLEGDLAGRARPLVVGTLDAMQRGGIHDHIGGGFHRYATDERWLLPHFEKMLYDNAQVARHYTAAWALIRDDAYRATACGALDWVLRDMTGAEGGFYSALDADSEGEEGRFYLWSHDDIMRQLGPVEGELFCSLYQVQPGGNVHDEATGRPTGLNIPHLAGPIPAEHAGRLARCRATLRDARAARVWPQLDDKVLAGWNGLMIGAFAHAGQAFAEPRYVAAAGRAARFLLANMMPGGRLHRVWRSGQARIPAFLEDHAALADGLLDLHEATGQAEWLRAARALADSMVARFVDAGSGGFFSTADDHEVLIARGRDTFDQAMPSATALALRVLARLAAITGESTWGETARRALAVVMPLVVRIPTGAAALVHAALLLDRPHGGSSCAGADGAPASRGAGSRAVAAPVSVTIEHQARAIRPGQEIDLLVRLVASEGWHVQVHRPADRRLYGTQIEVGGDFSLADARYPPGHPWESQLVYDGETAIPCRLKAAARLDDTFAAARIKVSWQACDNASCLEPASFEQELVFRVA